MKRNLWTLLCLLAMLAGSAEISAQEYKDYVAKEVTETGQIKTDGTTEYLIQIIEGGKPNQFVFSNGVTGEGAWVRPAGNTQTDAAMLLAGTVNNSHYYYFKFEAAGNSTFRIQNRGGYYWGKQADGQVKTSATALDITFEQVGDAWAFKTGDNYVNDDAKSNKMWANSSTRSTTYKIFAIEQPATTTTANFYYYDAAGTALNQVAKASEADGTSTVSALAALPAYVTATYFTDAAFTQPVDADAVATAGDYYVKTGNAEGFPLEIGVWSAVGNSAATLFFYTDYYADATKRYAVKAGGDWYNGFTFQRHDNKYLRHSGTNVGWTDKAEEATVLDFLFADGVYKMQVRGEELYLQLSKNGVLFSQNATDLCNQREGVVHQILSEFPAARYVGAYTQGQEGEITFDDIFAGRGRIALDPQKYYFIELFDYDHYMLSTADLTYRELPNTTVLTGYISDNADFAGLWQFTDRGLMNTNAGYGFNSYGKLNSDIVPARVEILDVVGTENRPACRIVLNADENYLFFNPDATNASNRLGAGKNPTSQAYWYLREAEAFQVPLTVAGTKSYATLCAPVALTIADDDYTKAYTATLTEVNGQKVVDLTEINGVIPAGTPLLLMNEYADTAAVFQLSYEGGEAASDNNWKGTYLPIHLGSDVTVCNQYRAFDVTAGGVPGFFTPTAEAVIPANSAYLANMQGEESKIAIRFPNGEISTIDSAVLQKPSTSGNAYDLSGRRVSRIQPGQIYIQGDRKMIAR